MKLLLPLIALVVVAGCSTTKQAASPALEPAVTVRPTAVSPPPLPKPITRTKSAPQSTAQLAVVPNFGTITLAWDYPPEEFTTNVSFNLRASADPTLPLAQWQIVTNTTSQQVTLPITPGFSFFICTATNSIADTNAGPNFGIGRESPPSNWAPRDPIVPSGTRISR